MNLSKYFGPSTLVAAAFIGPGTLTACTLAGANTGYDLLWALVFAVFATIVFQEMAARLGLISQQGLGEAIRGQLQHPVVRIAAIVLVIAAIGIGNAAYEAGNITGAVLGMQALAGNWSLELSFATLNLWPLVLGLLSFGLLWVGNFKLLERLLIGLVVLMGLVFLVTAIVLRPPLGEVFSGFVPRFSGTPWLTVLALIGTTVVPYNLFLHASSVREKYKDASQLSDLRKENATAILLGGFISMCIVVTSATAFHASGIQVGNAAQMATQLEPLLGSWATGLMGLGLFAAGLSSAITAPLAASYALKGVLGWEGGIRSLRFRTVWMVILVLGTLFAMLGYSPLELIQLAQVANGLLLPVIALFLLVMVNRKKLLANYVNTTVQNVLAGLVMLVVLLLTYRTILSLFAKWA